MVQYTINKNRVIIRDEHVCYNPIQWKTMMRQVIGRHYSNLQGNGPAWSFSSQNLETFSKLISQTIIQPDQSSDEHSVTSSCYHFTDDVEQQSSISSEEEQKSISSEKQQSSISSEKQQSISSEEQQQSISSEEEQQSSISSSSIGEEVSEIQPVFSSIATQTEWQEEKLMTYSYDVDENLKKFVKNWIYKNIKD